MTAALVAGLLAGYGIAVPVGAVATYLVSLTARTSLRVGASAALGVATADGFYALVAVVGGAALVPLLEPVTTPLRWVSAGVLIAIAVRGAAMAIGRQPDRNTGTPVRPGRAYAGLLGMTMLNPTTVIYFAALVLGGASAPGAAERTAFVLAAFAASASWQLVLAGGGALLGRTLTGARGRLITAMLSSLLITSFAVHLVVSA